MKAILIDEEKIKEILTKLAEIERKSGEVKPDPENEWLDNQELCLLLKISKRTAQNYRDQRILGCSKFGSKVYYRLSDVHAVLNKNYTPPNL